MRVAVAVRTPGGTRWTGRGVGREDALPIGSVAKTWTAAAVRATGVDLDAAVAEHVPELDVPGVTVRHLLTHTSGLDGDLVPRDARDAAAFAAAVARAEPVHAPGERWSYCNAGYAVLGLLVERVTGDPIADAVRALVLDPAGLRSSAMRGRNAPPVLDPAGGAAVATANDLVTFATTVVADDEPGVALPHGLGLMGLGWFVTDVDGTRARWHHGDTGGHVASLVHVPEAEVAVACVTEGGTVATHRTILATVLVERLGVLAGVPWMTLPAPTDIAVDAEAYRGVYVRGDREVTVRGDDRGLALTVRVRACPPETFRLRSVDAATFVAVGADGVAVGVWEFVRNTERPAAYVIGELRAHRRAAGPAGDSSPASK